MHSLRRRLRSALRGRAIAKQPIIFDFTKGRAYRATAKGLAETLEDAAAKATKPRIVKTIIGVPPQVLTQPKK